MKVAPSNDALHKFMEAVVATWAKLVDMVMTQPVLKWALISMAMVLLGSKLRGSLPLLGGFMRFLGNLGLIVALLATVLGLVDLSSLGITSTIPEAIERLMPAGGDAEQTVQGNTTRIALSRDGHFWVKAKVNGAPVRFLIDTGATLTTLSPETATKAGVHSEGSHKVDLKTANGRATGRIAQIDALRVGNIVARRTQAVIAPGIGETNVLGMNFLTQLDSWRVEGNVLVLVPHHPAKAAG